MTFQGRSEINPGLGKSSYMTLVIVIISQTIAVSYYCISFHFLDFLESCGDLSKVDAHRRKLFVIEQDEGPNQLPFAPAELDSGHA